MTSSLLHLDYQHIGAIELPIQEAQDALYQIQNKTGKGADSLGWVDLPLQEETLLDKINIVANNLARRCDHIVCIGIGGSYLGAKAVIEALSDPFGIYKETKGTSRPKLFFAGHHLDEYYHQTLLEILKGKSFGIIYISKSGSTLESSIAFRLFQTLLYENVGAENAREQIIAITDPDKGTLLNIAKNEGYQTFSIPPSVGGRFSVLSPVGLFPIALAGFDIKAILNGAKEAMSFSGPNVNAQDNLSAKYATIRQYFYKNEGKKIELLASYTPSLYSLCEWWKQLFAESEGKENKGLFVQTAQFSTDLHSIGQWIQEGERTIIETKIMIRKPSNELKVPHSLSDLDNLNYIAGKSLFEINSISERGTTMAHKQGNVPVLRLEIDKIDEYHLGGLIYFFEMASAISGYIQGVNPFDQPGVEAYKKNIQKLLKKLV